MNDKMSVLISIFSNKGLYNVSGPSLKIDVKDQRSKIKDSFLIILSKIKDQRFVYYRIVDLSLLRANLSKRRADVEPALKIILIQILLGKKIGIPQMFK